MFYERDFNIWECMVFEATTDPSNLNLETPVNNKGCAVLREGVHKALWKIGKHKGQYKALVQANPCQVIRDNNRDDKLILPIILTLVCLVLIYIGRQAGK